MSEIAIEVDGLSKRYFHTIPRYHTVIGRMRHLFSSAGRLDPVWALSDVSFRLERGDCLGISGPNGSGKSTLLKVIAGILEPTSGTVTVRGRTNTFFAIGAGVQGELSVRDNIEISGILMGLRRREILRRMDTILDFAELARLADVRMAELSTGQSARVSFSTALHADLDILLVDEILSVGDAAFQKRCEEAFARLRREGKTLLIASHEPAVLTRLGTHALRLSAGRVESFGAAAGPPAGAHA